MLLQILKNKKILYTVVGFLPLSVSLLFTPVYIHYLSVKDYGFLSIYNTLIGLIAPFLHFGIKDGFGFLYWKNNETEGSIDLFFKKTISSMVIVQSITIIACVTIGAFIFEHFFDSLKDSYYKPFFYIAAFYAMFLNFNDLFFYFFRNKGKIKEFLLLNILSLVTMTIGSFIGIVLFNKGLYGAILGKFIGYIIVVVFFLIKYFNSFKISIDFSFIKNIVKSGFPILIAVIIGAYFSIADKYYIQKYFSLDSMGIYGMAITIMYVVDVFLTSSMHFVLPELLNKLKLNVSKLKLLKPIIEVFHLMAFFCFFVLALSPLVINHFPIEYIEVLMYLPFLCIMPFIKFIFNLNSVNFYLYENSNIFLIIQIISAIILTILFYLISPILFIYGAILLSLSYPLIQLILTIIFLPKQKRFLLINKKLFGLLLTVLFLLVSLGLLYNATHFSILFVLPLILYSITFITTEKNIINSWGNYIKNNINFKF